MAEAGVYGQREDFIIYACMVVGQALTWLWLYGKEGPLRAPLHRFLANDPARTANVEINGNTPAQWSFWMIVALHHGLGGLLALIGLLGPKDSAVFITIFRLGLSFEIGEDVLHYCQMLYTVLFPPGAEVFAELWADCSTWFGIACHHAVGLFAGSFVFIYMPENYLGQYCSVVLLLSAVPQLIPFMFMPFEDLKSAGASYVAKAAAVLTVLGTLFAFVCRMFLFPPAAWQLGIDVEPIYGNGARIFLMTVAGLFMIFAVATLAISFREIAGTMKAFCATPADERVNMIAAAQIMAIGATEAQSKLATTFTAEYVDERRRASLKQMMQEMGSPKAGGAPANFTA